jgi:hypothetical protein
MFESLGHHNGFVNIRRSYPIRETCLIVWHTVLKPDIVWLDIVPVKPLVKISLLHDSILEDALVGEFFMLA